MKKKSPNSCARLPRWWSPSALEVGWLGSCKAHWRDVQIRYVLIMFITVYIMFILCLYCHVLLDRGITGNPVGVISECVWFSPLKGMVGKHALFSHCNHSLQAQGKQDKRLCLPVKVSHHQGCACANLCKAMSCDYRDASLILIHSDFIWLEEWPCFRSNGICWECQSCRF